MPQSLGTTSKLGVFLALLFGLSTFACATEAPSLDQESPGVTQVHPGAIPYPTDLARRLARALQDQGADYVPRTHHLREDGGPVYTNRLIFEDSPYLLQHAHNPVDWYPWGDEAFERARQEDKPIFLSIGYSTCHWCHVMERESFESEEIARILNEGFISIKIDRERRPDVDDLYMTAVQLLTGSGGWPMTTFLTPQGKPFFGGTYFPPDRFSGLLRQVRTAWIERRGEIEASAGQIAERIDLVTSARGEVAEVGRDILERTVQDTLRRHDPVLGGFGRAPKFPQESELLFLLQHHWRHGHQGALEASLKSLDAMARGGIYDQVGGGFHRYSTDARWLVPHFEKMLYNQAHLSRAYLAGYQLSGEAFLARIVRQTLDYVLREMTDASGAFYSATDADSEGREGTFFLWTREQLNQALGEEDGRWVGDLWGVTEAGNFEHSNVLHLPLSLADLAAQQEVDLGKFLGRLDALREKLWQVRETREHPLLDRKILTAWNGMMITAMAEAGDQLAEPRYLQAAEKAGEFLWQHSRDEGGQLLRVHLDGRASLPGLQEDYAYLAEAFLSIHDATGEASWLERARDLTDRMVDRFWDEKDRGFFMGASPAESLLPGRPKSPGDGATPSGNSVAVRVLARLAHRTGEARYQELAEGTVQAFSERIQRHPSGFSYLLLGLEELLEGDVGIRQFGARGKVVAEARWVDERRLEVGLRIAEGWHVNAHEPLSEDLLPTVLSSTDEAETLEVAYPPAEEVRLSFQEDVLAVYQGTVRLIAHLENNQEEVSGRRPPLLLRFQACDDRVCLRPEEMKLEVLQPPA